jgi:hypothetical protein
MHCQAVSNDSRITLHTHTHTHTHLYISGRQYHLTHDPMGKPDGWYDYDSQNSKEVEVIKKTVME